MSDNHQENGQCNRNDDYNANCPSTNPYQIQIPAHYAGKRLDQAISALVPEYSRSRLQSWIQDGHITVDGQTVNAKHKVRGLENVQIIPSIHPSEQAFTAQDIELDILYEDDSLLIINKPAGLVVHPGNGNWESTLLNALLHYEPSLNEVPRAGIVHRLDKDTSGLLVVAKNLVAQTNLVRQLQARTVKRQYLALIHGELDFDGRIDAPIGRHPTQRTRMAVVDNGKEATTHFTIERMFPSCTLVRCNLETGRTHQIRVHFSHCKYPLVGDPVYTKGAQKCIPELREILAAFPRQALHATRLGLNHPRTGKYKEWRIDLPQDLSDLLMQIEEIAHAIE